MQSLLCITHPIEPLLHSLRKRVLEAVGRAWKKSPALPLPCYCFFYPSHLSSCLIWLKALGAGQAIKISCTASGGKRILILKPSMSNYPCNDWSLISQNQRARTPIPWLSGHFFNSQSISGRRAPVNCGSKLAPKDQGVFSLLGSQKCCMLVINRIKVHSDSASPYPHSPLKDRGLSVWNMTGFSPLATFSSVKASQLGCLF